MAQGNLRHAFPGGNTSQGFFSYYEYIIEKSEAKRIFVLKGGPGVGKSTFMRKIGEAVLEDGFDVEFMHCSSDNSSLDGVVVPELKIALIDGTAPHVVDPRYPGAVDEILHLGDYWVEDAMAKNKEDIVKHTGEIGKLFNRAYRYLKAAACIMDDTAEIYKQAMDFSIVNAFSKKITTDLFSSRGVSAKLGKVRKLFGSAITPDGLKEYLDTLLTGWVYIVKGHTGTGTEKVLERVMDAAVENGHDVEAFYCALNPKKLEHLVIPSIGISLSTTNVYHSTKKAPYLMVDLDDIAVRSIPDNEKQIVEDNTVQFDSLINSAVKTIKTAKGIHDKLETFYIPNMRFDEIDACMNRTLSRIREYADELCIAGLPS